MTKRILLRIGDFIFVTRPLILIPAWSFYLLGARAGISEPGGGAPAELPDAGLVCLTAILVTAYLVNQIFDRESDRLNHKGHYLTDGLLSVRTIVAMALVFFVTAAIAFRDAVPAQRIPLAVSLVVSLVYSLPPIRLCARPFADLAANALGYGGLAFVIGFASRSEYVISAWLRSLPWVLMVGATFLHTTILDIDGDDRSGKITTSVKIGVGWSALLAVLLAAAGTGWAWAVSWRSRGDLVAPVVLTISLAAFFYAYVRVRRVGLSSGDQSQRVSSNAVQLSTFTATAAAVIFAPLYLLLLVPLVILSRFYYRARFGLRYPGPARAARDA
ncbi:MAG: UbiA family prenyltransferase [Candidatus Krumholzibacteriota bacterium]|nr:UbiA family prenyltransferase [Candidatus Krumholzibacteriota bacterium]